MSAVLEAQVGQALHAARLLEDALHSTGRWTMRWGSAEVQAFRHIEGDVVVLVAEFPATCWIERPDGCLLLMLDGQMRGLRRVQDPGDDPFRVTWTLEAAQVVRESA